MSIPPAAIFGNGLSYAGNGVLAALSNIQTTIIGTAVNVLESSIGPWRPPGWSQPAVTSIRIPGTPGSSGNNSTSGASVNSPTNFITSPGGIPTISVIATGVADNTGTPDTILIFDGILRLEHEQRSTPTEFPVQTGANLSDHIYSNPAKLVMEIFMSDVMQSYTPGQFSSSNTRSVSAYHSLLDLMNSRTPVTITTKLDTYKYMCLVNMHTPDSHQTIQSLKTTCTFQQIFTAQISTSNVSSRTGDTDLTNLGNIPTLPVPGVITDNYLVLPPAPAQSVVPYSGTYSSNPVDDATFGGF